MLPPIVEDKNSTISTVRTYSSPKRYTLKGKGKN